MMRPGVSRFRMSLGEMGPRGGRSTTTQAVSTCCLAALLCWWMPLRVTRYARYRAEVDPLEGDSQSFQGHFTLLPGLWADAGSRAWADCRWLRLPERPGDGLLLSRQEPSSELNGARALALALLFAHPSLGSPFPQCKRFTAEPEDVVGVLHDGLGGLHAAARPVRARPRSIHRGTCQLLLLLDSPSAFCLGALYLGD